jgi:hypothetical protein
MRNENCGGGSKSQLLLRHKSNEDISYDQRKIELQVANETGVEMASCVVLVGNQPLDHSACLFYDSFTTTYNTFIFLSSLAVSIYVICLFLGPSGWAAVWEVPLSSTDFCFLLEPCGEISPKLKSSKGHRICLRA